ncbi:MAG: DUF2141 domain-containing protein [Bacteroidetes bacterium]|nr:DUF2141 domain-containing protein [Bacteroidota bacterium]
MQNVFVYLVFLITGIFAQAQNTIEVSINEFKNNDGKVMVGLYNEEAKWLAATYVSLSSEITNKKAKVTFTEIPDGVYAISCYHDKDSNGKLNMMMGMVPAEPYGCSNGAKGFFGPPKWEDARFEVKNGALKKMDINL